MEREGKMESQRERKPKTGIETDKARPNGGRDARDKERQEHQDAESV